MSLSTRSLFTTRRPCDLSQCALCNLSYFGPNLRSNLLSVHVTTAVCGTDPPLHGPHAFTFLQLVESVLVLLHFHHLHHAVQMMLITKTLFRLAFKQGQS